MYVITLLADMASDILFGTSSDILYHGESLIPVKTKTMSVGEWTNFPIEIAKTIQALVRV